MKIGQIKCLECGRFLIIFDNRGHKVQCRHIFALLKNKTIQYKMNQIKENMESLIQKKKELYILMAEFLNIEWDERYLEDEGFM